MGSISFINKKGSSTGDVKLNVFVQETEPEIKEGIWVKTSKQANKVYITNTLSADFEKNSIIILNNEDVYRAMLAPTIFNNVVGKLENSFKDVYYFSDTTVSSGNKTFMYEGEEYTIPAQKIVDNGGFKYVFYAINKVPDYFRFYGIGTNEPVKITDTGEVSCTGVIKGTSGLAGTLQEAINSYAAETTTYTYSSLDMTTVVWSDYDIVNVETGEIVYPQTIPDGIDNSLPTYYGTGTEWVKFKN